MEEYEIECWDESIVLALFDFRKLSGFRCKNQIDRLFNRILVFQGGASHSDLDKKSNLLLRRNRSSKIEMSHNDWQFPEFSEYQDFDEGP